MAPMRKPTHRPATEFGETYARTVSLPAAADKLGLSVGQLRQKLGRGDLPFVEIRGRIRVPEEALVGRR